MPDELIKPFYERGGITLYNADCLDVLPQLPAQSIDLVLCDPPYGSTACAWDSIIPLDRLWREYKRLIKPTGALVFTASQPFTTALISSNLAWFRYCWVWDKVNLFTNHLNADIMPMKQHEDIVVFYPAQPTYNPQPRRGKPYTGRGLGTIQVYGVAPRDTGNLTGLAAPATILSIPARTSEQMGLHPTQKPLPLVEYLIRTYSNPGDLVLDNAFGSCTTGRACKNLGRRFVGMERDTTEGYCQIAADRLAQEVLGLDGAA